LTCRAIAVVGLALFSFSIENARAQHPCSGFENCLATLRSNDPSARAGAVFILGNLKDRRAAPALMDLLEKESSREVRFSTVRALGSISDPVAVPVLSKMLKDDDLRTEAVKALVRIGGPSAITALVEALQDRDVQLAVVQGLGEIADPAAKPHLIALYRSTGDERIRGLALMAIHRIQSVWGPTEAEMGLPIYPGSEFIPNARAEWIFATKDPLSKVSTFYQQRLKQPPLSFEAFRKKHESGFGESKAGLPANRPALIFIVEEQLFQGRSYPSKLIFLKNSSRETEIQIFDALGSGD
jgi:hypothetical protein